MVESVGLQLLETLASQSQNERLNQSEAIELPLQQDAQGIWRTDWSPLLPMLANGRFDIATRAYCFHESLAQALLKQALELRENESPHQPKPFVVGLSGGVFQNRLLTERVMRLLDTNGFQCFLPEHVPINDAGLCYGQVMEYHAIAPL